MPLRLRYRLGRLLDLFRNDEIHLDPSVLTPTQATHLNNLDVLAAFANHAGKSVLEIGSREVTGRSDARARFAAADYTGFDYYPGNNVDVIGDVHHLEACLGDRRFDLIYTKACFEHFAMPWIVTPQIARLLKVGGRVYVETHFSFSSHERPWNFFQFSDMGLRVLFPPALGIECIEAGMSNPMVGRFSRLADPYLRYGAISGLYCHSSFLGRKVREVEKFSWQDLVLDDVVAHTRYPEPAADR